MNSDRRDVAVPWQFAVRPGRVSAVEMQRSLQAAKLKSRPSSLIESGKGSLESESAMKADRGVMARTYRCCPSGSVAEAAALSRECTAR